ncbi:hypothetical protein ABTL79_19030, partial [Acinetobacter baumannii]
MPNPARAGILARLFVLVFFIGWACPAGAAPTLRFADAEGAASLTGRLDYLRDPTGRLGIGDVAFGPAAGDFVTPSGLFNL